MIDLFSILFSTSMVMLIVFRAIPRDATMDKRPEYEHVFGSLNNAGKRPNRDPIR